MFRKGFTLVELSVVLVIIGLIIGGILIAQSMIDTARGQRVINDLQKYEVAVKNFKSSYRFYPGDSPDFSIAGNGDNVLYFAGAALGCGGGPMTDGNENYQVFIQMSEAGMLDKSYAPYTPVGCINRLTFFSNYKNSAPVIPLNSSAAAMLLVNFYPIIAYKDTATRNFRFRLYLNPQYMTQLQQKIGALDYDGTDTQVGGVAYPNVGICSSADYTGVPCTSSTATFGQYYYYLEP